MAIQIRYPTQTPLVDASGLINSLADFGQELKARRAVEPYLEWLGQPGQPSQPASLADLSPQATSGIPDAASQRVAQAHAASGANPPSNGAIEAYIRHAAAKRGIDPDTAIKVAMSEGGVSDPFRQSDVVKDGVREQSYGPFQLYMNGGLGNEALAAGIDPRQDWKGGIDFALDKAKELGWGPWYGAKKVGITGRDGIGQGSGPSGASQPVQTAQATPAGNPGLSLPPPDVMRSLFRSKETRPLAVALAQSYHKARLGDPEEQLRLEKLRLEVDQLRNGSDGVFGTPIYGTDQETGETVLGAIGKNGSFRRIDTGGVVPTPGVTFQDFGTYRQGFDTRSGKPVGDPITKENMQEEAQKAAGKEVGKREGELPVLRSKALSTLESLDQQRGIVNDEIDRAIGEVSGSPTLTTGLVGGLSKAVPGTPAYALAKKLETIKANIGFDKLQQMRENSPTGGALGQVSDFENRQLQSVFGNLEQAQSAEDIVYNLRRLKDLLAESRRTRQEAFERDFGGGQATPNGNRTSSGVQWSIEE